jgi:hypothetical protein
MFILGWTPRGRATASATALLGPWPDSPMLWGRSCPLLIAFGAVTALGAWCRHHRLLGVALIIKYSSVLGRARHQPLIPYKIGPFGEPIKNGLLGRFPTLRKDRGRNQAQTIRIDEL